MDGLRSLVDELREAAGTDPTKGWLAKYGGHKSAVAKFDTGSWKHGASEPPPKAAAAANAAQMAAPLPPKQKWVSAGCVILPSLHPDDLNFVYVIKPSNNYGPWAFPKGRIDKGESAPEAARREVQEETGLVVSILPGGYLGKGVGGYSITHFFMAVQVGGSPGPQDHEVQEVRLASFEEAWKLFKSSGNSRDLGILQQAWKFTDKFRQRTAGRNVGDLRPASGGQRSWAVDKPLPKKPKVVAADDQPLFPKTLFPKKSKP